MDGRPQFVLQLRRGRLAFVLRFELGVEVGNRSPVARDGRLEEGFRYTRGIDQIPVASARREGNEVLEAARLECSDPECLKAKAKARGNGKAAA